MIAVADGHGQQGHNVSQFVIKMLSKIVSEEVGKLI
jgi:serine/threonine protein phosphatase PrpC